MLRYEEEQIALLRMILQQLRETNDNLETLNNRLSQLESDVNHRYD